MAKELREGVGWQIFWLTCGFGEVGFDIWQVE
jgi:hypothetical protein